MKSRITWTDKDGTAQSIVLDVSTETALALLTEDIEIAREGGDSVTGRIARGEPMIRVEKEASS